MTNPLLENNAVPAFDRIAAEHFEPAFDIALAKARKTFEAIKAAPASMKDTVLPLEGLFHEMTAIMSVLEVYYAAKVDDAIREAAQNIQLKVSAFSKEVMQDRDVAAKFKAVYDARNTTPGFDAEDMFLLKKTYQSFENEGAFLDDAGQKRLKQIDDKLIPLTLNFEKYVMKAAEQQAILITDESEIKDLDSEIRDSMAQAAQEQGKKGWLFVPERKLVDDLLTVAQSRIFREKIFRALNAMGTQAPYSNEPVLKEIHALRHERALLLGYPNHAAGRLGRTMAGSLERVMRFLTDVSAKAMPQLESEMRAIEKFAASKGFTQHMEPWDSPYWAERYKAETFRFDAAEMKPYLELNNVMDGMFLHLEKLFGLKLSENKTYPRYHEDVRTYDVTNAKTGEKIGIMYADFYQRGGTKQFGAWMSDIQAVAPGRERIVSINANYMKPSPGNPTFITLGHLETLYHEMGHALHGLLGTKTKYKSLHGTASPPDYVEIHSMTLENFATLKSCLKGSLRHFETGAAPPDELLDRMEKSSSFFRSESVMKIVQNALWDFGFHTSDPKDYTVSGKVQMDAMLKNPYIKHARPYPLTRFTHIIGGYDAGYYGYLWSQAHAADNTALFEEKGVYHAETAARLKKFYSAGSGRDYNETYEAFRGRKATPDAMLGKIGVAPEGRLKRFGRMLGLNL